MIGAGSSETVYDVAVVGAGAAGLGAAVALKHAGENFVVCERQTVERMRSPLLHHALVTDQGLDLNSMHELRSLWRSSIRRVKSSDVFA